MPSEVLLLVEVSDSTLRLDRGQKRAAYAEAGISEYWIANVVGRVLEVYRNPSGSRYRSRRVLREDATDLPQAATGAPIRVADLLPPRP